MMSRRYLSLVVLCGLAACGGGGGGGSAMPPGVHATATPAATATPSATPGAYATLAPASSREGDVKTLATGAGASAIAYWADYNVVATAFGSSVVDAADGTKIAAAPDGNTITALAYAPATHSIVFTTGTTVYAVAAGGQISTVASGLSYVGSLAAAPDGTLYALEGDRIVKISGGSVSDVTAPGSIGPEFWYEDPSIVVASDGSLLLSDPTNDRIVHVSAAGSITPFVGSCKAYAGASGTAGNCWAVPRAGTGSVANFGNPGALAYDGSTGTLYVADNRANQLWSVSSSGMVTAVAGYGFPFNADGNGPAAFLNAPVSIAFQPASKSVDILENANSQQEIAAFSTAGSLPPAYTPPAKPFYFTQGLAVNDLAAGPDGGAWAFDGDRQSIDRISPDGAVTQYSHMANVAPTWHVAVDASGDAWFLASRTNMIVLDEGLLEVTPSGTQTYVAATPQHNESGPVQMQAVTIGPDGNPWFTETESSLWGGSFGFVNASTHAISQYATPATLIPNGISSSATGIAFSAGSAVHIATLDGSLGSRYAISTNGAVNMIYRAADKSIWFTGNDGTIADLSATGTEQDYRCTTCAPVDLTLAPDGSVWADEGSSGAIVRITPAGQMMQYLLPVSVAPTYGISARPDGKLWVYENAGVLFLFDPSAYDAMNGPHPTAAVRRHGSALRMPWHRV